MRRAAAYIRVSTEEQVENHSLSAQRHEIERFCERNGFELTAVYSDEGVSAHVPDISKRPQLGALLADAEKGLFDVAVVHTLDRFARNIGVQRQALVRLSKAKVALASCAEDIDFLSPSGNMMFTMIGAVSEFFSDQLGVHVGKGLRERAVSGLPVGPVPFGYASRGAALPPEPVEDEANAVRTIFERRVGGDSLAQLAAWLNDQGFQTRKGSRFSAHSIKDMLKCGFYRGVITFKEEEFPGRHDAIIPESLFERVAVMRMRRQASPRRSRGGATGCLRQLIACAACGRSIHAERNHRGYPLYRERHGQGCATDDRSISAKRIDGQMADIFGSIELPAAWRDRMTELTMTVRPAVDIAALQAKKRRIGRAYADGALDDSEYELQLRQIDELLRQDESPVETELEAAAGLFRDLGTLWAEATPDERQKMVSRLVDRVYLDIEAKQIRGIEPAPAFKILLDNAIERSPFAKCVITGPDSSSEELDGSVWWRRGRVELPVQRGFQRASTSVSGG